MVVDWACVWRRLGGAWVPGMWGVDVPASVGLPLVVASPTLFALLVLKAFSMAVVVRVSSIHRCWVQWDTVRCRLA